MDFKRTFAEIHKRIRSDVMIKECFCNDSNCQGRVISSHSIQNNRILRKIAYNGDVFVVGYDIDSDENFQLIIEPKGRKTATTFPGFCGYHDKCIFQPIEDKDYIINDQEQNFLFAYRAFSKEYYAKKTSSLVYHRTLEILDSKNINMIKDYFPSFNENIPEKFKTLSQSIAASAESGTNRTLNEMEKQKIELNNALMSKDFSLIETYCYVLDEEHDIAVSSIFFVEKDLQGNVVNTLFDFQNELKPLMLSIFPQNKKTYILLSFFNRHKQSYRFIEEQILNQTVYSIKTIISQMILNQVENFVISPIKWKRIPARKRSEYLKQFQETIFGKHSMTYNSETNLFV